MAENKWVTGVVTLLIQGITPLVTGRGPPCMGFIVLSYSREYFIAEFKVNKFPATWEFCNFVAFLRPRWNGDPFTSWKDVPSGKQT